MAGLLDIPGFDPAEFQVSDEERKKLLIGNILLGISAGAFNSNKGNQLGALGSGLLQGAMMGQRALSDAQAAKLDKLKAASGFMDFTQKKQAYQDDQAARGVLSNFKMPGPSLPDMAPTPANAAALAAQPKPGIYEQLQALADQFQAKGLDKKAVEYRTLAEKYRSEYDTTPRTGTDANNKRITYILDKQGNQKILPTGPDLEKLHFADAGGRIVGLDQFTAEQRGPGVSKTMDPGQADASKRGWAGLNLDQQKFLYQQSQDAQKQDIGKWQYDAERGGLVNLLTGDFKPAVQGGAPIGAKGESKKAESAQSAQSIIALASPLIEKSTGSYLGAGWDKVAQAFGVSTDGATAAAQLKVLQARLMTEQPRMEGPQSDRDVELYRDAAGQIGNPMVPAAQKEAALKTISALNKKYMQRTAIGATGGWSATEIK